MAKKFGGPGGEAEGFPGWAFAGVPVGLVLAVLGVWLPLRAGARAMRAQEF
jgi:hypothetical protein